MPAGPRLTTHSGRGTFATALAADPARRDAARPITGDPHMFRSVRPAFVRAAAVLPVLAACASLAGAQAGASRAVGIAVSGGANILQGDLSDAFETGFIVGGHLSIKPPLSPLGFRADVNYQRNNVKGGGANFNVVSGFANAVFTVPATAAPVRPYVLGGVGLGRLDFSLDDEDDEVFGSGAAETKFGFQVGAGLDIPLSGIGTFVEVGYQRYSLEGGSVGFIPIRAGIRF
jgi:opacity protein-like surface antigen